MERRTTNYWIDMKKIYSFLCRYFAKKSGIILDSTIIQWDFGLIIKDGKIFYSTGSNWNLTIWARALEINELKDAMKITGTIPRIEYVASEYE